MEVSKNTKESAAASPKNQTSKYDAHESVTSQPEGAGGGAGRERGNGERVTKLLLCCGPLSSGLCGPEELLHSRRPSPSRIPFYFIGTYQKANKTGRGLEGRD